MKISLQKRKNGSLSKSAKKEHRQLNLMTLPVVIWYTLFCHLPLFGIFFAFKEFTPVPGESLTRIFCFSQGSPLSFTDIFAFKTNLYHSFADMSSEKMVKY